MAPDRAQRRQHLANLEKKATRIAVGLVIAGFVLALVAIVLGSAEVFPYEYTVTVALTTMFVPVGLALLIGAMGRLYILGGWKVTPFGIVFVAGFAALVYALATADAGWRLAGVGLLAISGAAFFTAGTASGRAPVSARNTWGSAGSLVGGAATTVVGYLIDYWWVLLFGAMAVGCGIGVLIGRWQAGRRRATVPADHA
jgi:hypothetical protein